MIEILHYLFSYLYIITTIITVRLYQQFAHSLSVNGFRYTDQEDKPTFICWTRRTKVATSRWFALMKVTLPYVKGQTRQTDLNRSSLSDVGYFHKFQRVSFACGDFLGIVLKHNCYRTFRRYDRAGPFFKFTRMGVKRCSLFFLKLNYKWQISPSLH